MFKAIKRDPSFGTPFGASWPHAFCGRGRSCVEITTVSPAPLQNIVASYVGGPLEPFHNRPGPGHFHVDQVFFPKFLVGGGETLIEFYSTPTISYMYSARSSALRPQF